MYIYGLITNIYLKCPLCPQEGYQIYTISSGMSTKCKYNNASQTCCSYHKWGFNTEQIGHLVLMQVTFLHSYRYHASSWWLRASNIRDVYFLFGPDWMKQLLTWSFLKFSFFLIKFSLWVYYCPKT